MLTLNSRGRPSYPFCTLTDGKPKGLRQLPNSELNAALACFEIQAGKKIFFMMRSQTSGRNHCLSAEMVGDGRSPDGHLERAQRSTSLSPSFQTVHIVPPLLPALLGGSFVPYLPPDLLQSSLFQLAREVNNRVKDPCRTF